MKKKLFLLDRSLTIKKSDIPPASESTSAVCIGDTYCRTPPVADDAVSD